MPRPLPSLALALLLAAPACASLESRTARHTGCAESDVVISQKQGLINKTWRATCGGKQYLCTHTPQQSTGVGGISVTQAEQEHCVEADPVPVP